MVPVELEDEPDDDRHGADPSGWPAARAVTDAPAEESRRGWLHGRWVLVVPVAVGALVLGVVLGVGQIREGRIGALPAVLDRVGVELTERWRWTTSDRVSGNVPGDDAAEVRAVGDVVVVRTSDPERRNGLGSAYSALDVATGELRWQYPERGVSSQGWVQCTWPRSPAPTRYGACVTLVPGGEDVVERIDATTGEADVRVTVRDALVGATAWLDGLVVAHVGDDRLVVTRYDADGEVVWRLDEVDGGASLALPPRVRVIGETLVVDRTRKALVLGEDGGVLARWQDTMTREGGTALTIGPDVPPPPGSRGTATTPQAEAAVVTLDPIEDGMFLVGIASGLWGSAPARVIDSTGAVVLDMAGNPLLPVVDDGSVPELLLTTGADGSLTAWDLEARESVWRDPGQVAAAVVLGGTVYFTTGRSLFAVDARSGEYLWRTDLRGEAAAGGLSTDGTTLVVGSATDEGQLAVSTVDSASGRMLRQRAVAPVGDERSAWRVGFGGGGMLVVTRGAVRMLSGGTPSEAPLTDAP